MTIFKVPMLRPRFQRYFLLTLTTLISSLSLLTLKAQADTTTLYTAINAGNPTSNSAILWSRTTDLSQNGLVTNLNLQISTDPNFAALNKTYFGTTDASRDYTVNINATGLNTGTKYYYRFQNPQDNSYSQVGTFSTAPDPTAKVAVKFGFSGDYDGKWRPYPSTNGFSNNNLNFYVNLGDNIYETASTVSSATTSLNNPTTSSINQAYQDYLRKYRENLQPVSSSGSFSGLSNLFPSQGNYYLIDNHELANSQLINGGAAAANSLGLGVDPTNPSNDVNTTGNFINKTSAFSTLLKAYDAYQPISESAIVNAPNDPRSDGTQKQYLAQKWGANSIFINVDDRSYRDIRMKTSTGADDTLSSRGSNPDRTMLGQTQLAWLKQTLLQAQADKTPWKFIATSSPMDEIGLALGPSTGDSGKSWIGEYRAERNDLLKFIADNGIKNVVFISTDDHLTRVNEMTYMSDINDINSKRITIDGVISIVTGPIGAGGPDTITNHSFSNIKTLADTLAAQETNLGVNPFGLDPKYQGLSNVFRQGDPNADSLRQPADFYSPDTFNYTIFDISADGKTLTVDTYGINSYAANTFPQPDPNNPVRRILGFQLQAQEVPEPSNILGAIAGLGILATVRKKLTRKK
jgi:hypothetical protein